MIGEPGRHGWGARGPLPRSVWWGEQAEAVVGPAEVVGRADQPHAGREGGLGAGDGTTAPSERREVGAEGGVETLDVGGVDDGAGVRRGHDGLDTGQGAMDDAASDADDVAFGGVLH